MSLTSLHKYLLSGSVEHKVLQYQGEKKYNNNVALRQTEDSFQILPR